MKIIAFIEQEEVIKKFLQNVGLWLARAQPGRHERQLGQAARLMREGKGKYPMATLLYGTQHREDSKLWLCPWV